jgi:polyvinyl alcohol dehydrogenase (cytochrome)
MKELVLLGVGLGLFWAASLPAQAPAGADGAASYRQSCASCHDGGLDRAPSRDTFKAMAPEQVLAAMETGPMISMASRRTAAERRAIAEFVTGKALGNPIPATPLPQAMCSGPARDLSDPSAAPHWNGWGNGWGEDVSNTRFQDGKAAGLTAAQIPRLKVKWAFGFPGELTSNAQPTLAGGRVFTGSASGKVYSLSAATGCVHWYFDAGSIVRGAVSIGRVQTASGPRYAAFFGDGKAVVYALDASTGMLLWKTKVDDFPVARITGSLAYYNGRLYVPVASGEEAAGSEPAYECCRFRGSLVALDAATGKQIWKTYTIADPPQPTKKNKVGAQLWGPSGAPIWSSPAIDTKSNVVYVTTGDNYSEPASRMSDAFVAMDLSTGKILWSRQMTAQDAYTSACRLEDKTNCPDVNGPDFDFGSSPILVNLSNGRRALIGPQKSGMVHAVDPDQQGEVLWQVRVGKGGTMGGVQWGAAVDQSNVYVAVSDIKRVMLSFSTQTDADPSQGGGMYALNLATGAKVWYAAPASCGARPRCSPAQSAAVSAIPGAAFSGSVDGHLRAYSAKDGSVAWDFDTVRDYKTVNGVPGRGGSLDGPGPAIGGGMLFVPSGYVSAGGMPGNVLLAFSVDGN